MKKGIDKSLYSKLAFTFYQQLFYPVYQRKYKNYFDQVPVYCMFLGYPRSGHTLVGALLNAHPDAWIAHELNVLNYIEQGCSRDRIFAKLIAQGKWFASINSSWNGYSYNVPNQWQNKFRTMKVIGDKRGGASTRRINKNPQLLDKLQQIIDKKIKIIHVYRNPFDNISTRAHGGKVDKVVTNDILSAKIDRHFKDVATIDKIRKENKYDILEFGHENFIAKPAEYLEKLCNFLGIDPLPDYINDCTSVVKTSPSKSRHKIDWWYETIADVESRMKHYDFLESYSFEE